MIVFRERFPSETGVLPAILLGSQLHQPYLVSPRPGCCPSSAGSVTTWLLEADTAYKSCDFRNKGRAICLEENQAELFLLDKTLITLEVWPQFLTLSPRVSFSHSLISKHSLCGCWRGNQLNRAYLQASSLGRETTSAFPECRISSSQEGTARCPGSSYGQELRGWARLLVVLNP